MEIGYFSPSFQMPQRFSRLSIVAFALLCSILTSHSFVFKSGKTIGRFSKYESLKMISVVVFGPDAGFRVHDNPALRIAVERGDDVIPVLISNPDLSPETREVIEKSIAASVKELGGDLLTVSKSTLGDLISQVCHDANNVTVTYSKRSLSKTADKTSYSIWNSIGIDCFKRHNIDVIGVLDDFVDGNLPYGYSQAAYQYPRFQNQLYRDLDGIVPKPVMKFDLKFKAIKNDIKNKFKAQEEKRPANSKLDFSFDEDFGISLIRDYLKLGEIAFTKKYASLFAETFATSVEHRQSLDRLVMQAERDGQSPKVFQGEVLSGLLSPLLQLGVVSPRLLVHARSVLFPGIKAFGLERPLVCRLTAEVIRKDWHVKLARVSTTGSYGNPEIGLTKPDASAVNRTPDTFSSADAAAGSLEGQSFPAISAPVFSAAAIGGPSSGWATSFTYWKGYLQREGWFQSSLGSSDNTDSKSIPSAGVVDDAGSQRPVAVLLHGFGGSLDQFTGLAAEIAAGGMFDVFALDSLGFGFSEKPPISYNQYLWRDQVVQTLQRVAPGREVILMGNSIGGFTATAVAAALANAEAEEIGNQNELSGSESKCVKVRGLVLMNSAGRILPPTTTAAGPSPGFEPFPEYNGPASQFLRLFGKGIFSFLQPRIQETCEWLYPTNPAVVQQSGLAANIFRDSCDPGAHDVIAAGGKLPPPAAINDLLSEYKGPVLVAQGALDPLNDAPGRAKQFAAIREGIHAELLQLGHCPMDEGPKQVYECIQTWARREKIVPAIA